MKRGVAIIKDFLASSGWSQKKLAEEAGLTESSISKYISGEREPSLMTVSKLAEAMSMKPMDLLKDFMEEE